MGLRAPLKPTMGYVMSLCAKFPAWSVRVWLLGGALPYYEETRIEAAVIDYKESRSLMISHHREDPPVFTWRNCVDDVVLWEIAYGEYVRAGATLGCGRIIIPEVRCA